MEAEEHDTLDQWENDLASDVSSIEEVEVSSIVLEENQVNTAGSVEDASHAVTQVLLWGTRITQVTQTIPLKRLVMQVTQVTQIVLWGTQDNQVALMYRQIPRSSPFLPRI